VKDYKQKVGFAASKVWVREIMVKKMAGSIWLRSALYGCDLDPALILNERQKVGGCRGARGMGFRAWPKQ